MYEQKINELTKYFTKYFEKDVIVKFDDVADYEIWSVIDSETNEELTSCFFNGFYVEECEENSKIENLIESLEEEFGDRESLRIAIESHEESQFLGEAGKGKSFMQEVYKVPEFSDEELKEYDYIFDINIKRS